MRYATFQRRGPISRFRFFCMMSLGIVLGGVAERAEAEAVDSELVLLVDVTKRGLSDEDFARLMDGCGAAFERRQVLDSIRSGAFGQIAVSLIFFGAEANPQIGIPWMVVGSRSDARRFSALARELERPRESGPSGVGPALRAAVLSFGNETGNAANGFESCSQMVEVIGLVTPDSEGVDGVSSARKMALAAGVDRINWLPFRDRSGRLRVYDDRRLSGGVVAGAAMGRARGAGEAGLVSLLAEDVALGIASGAITSISRVPQPSAVLGLLSGLALLLIRRKRQG